MQFADLDRLAASVALSLSTFELYRGHSGVVLKTGYLRYVTSPHCHSGFGSGQFWLRLLLRGGSLRVQTWRQRAGLSESGPGIVRFSISAWLPARVWQTTHGVTWFRSIRSRQSCYSETRGFPTARHFSRVSSSN